MWWFDITQDCKHRLAYCVFAVIKRTEWLCVWLQKMCQVNLCCIQIDLLSGIYPLSFFFFKSVSFGYLVFMYKFYLERFSSASLLTSSSPVSVAWLLNKCKETLLTFCKKEMRFRYASIKVDKVCYFCWKWRYR